MALSGVTTTVEVSFNVVFLSCFEQLQWLSNHVLQDGRGEILVDVFLVDRYFASTFREVNTSYSALAATNCIYYFHFFSLFILVNVDGLGLLSSLVVLGSFEYVEVAKQMAA